MPPNALTEPPPKFFASPNEWRAWLERHHANKQQLWVGFYKRDSGRPSITWPEGVDGALCFGWIDGVRKSIDGISYKIRWANELSKLGLMHSAGLAAFEKRDGERSAIYAYEQRKAAKLPPPFEKKFRACVEAWKFFQSQPPWYQRTSTYWVISAKKEETRSKRLATLIDCSARKRNIPSLNRPSGSK